MPRASDKQIPATQVSLLGRLHEGSTRLPHKALIIAVLVVFRENLGGEVLNLLNGNTVTLLHRRVQDEWSDSQTLRVRSREVELVRIPF